MANRIITLSGWGQPHDALAAIAPKARHIDYAHHHTISGALGGIAEQARDFDVVIGWSLGGQLAARAIAAGLFRPKKLVLIAAPYQFVATPQNPLGMKHDLYDKFRSNVARHPERALHKAWELILKGDGRADRVRNYLESQDQKKTLEKNWLRWLDRLEGFSFDGADFANFPPTLLIHGDQDAVVDSRQSQRFFAVIPGAKLIIMQDAGHAPHWHDADSVQKAIENYVR